MTRQWLWGFLFFARNLISDVSAGPPLVAIVGATATGKSALAIDLARTIGAEVINADAMQFYRGMDIGTAKVPLAERHGVVHHQIDTLDVHQDATVAQFHRDATKDMEDIVSRGSRTVVVGGSGLYIRALLDGFTFAPTDPEVRSALEKRAQDHGPGVLHRELAEVDPVAAQKIDARNTKRIVRALEIIALTGRYTSALPERTYARPTVQIGLRLSREVLVPRIESRVTQMWRAGLVEETEQLVAQGIRRGVTAQRAVGYAETLRFIDGEIDEEETRALIVRHTTRLARKQRSWFGADDRVQWIDAPRDEGDVARAVRDVCALLDSLES